MSDRKRFSDAAAIISGGAGGMGRAVAQRLADEGAKVLIADLDGSAAEEQARAIGGHAAQLDVTDAASWEACVERAEELLGPISVLVNAAGIFSLGSIFDTSAEDWKRSIAINLEGTYLGCRAALPSLRRAEGGAIVNIASTSGIQGDPRTVAYDAGKAGVRALTKEIAVHCARQGYAVRCNSVHPGATQTPMLDDIASQFPNLYADWGPKYSPFGRVAKPTEIGSLVAFLASPDASFITGSAYVIDGGATA
ncbi:MAG: hypothetical protein QOE75_916 [Solirubrobacterales bacterium]|jgi:NAD(P)-dependent dehydrogenase (short-subunit alcohol dehydrogenase family)|nr:hypothetical protein [Solirubrobacterales bacterium]